MHQSISFYTLVSMVENAIANDETHLLVREVREKAGLSQEAFAEKLNVSARSIRNWESKSRASPRVSLHTLHFILSWHFANDMGGDSA